MDIVRLLAEAIARLPHGDYTMGLNATIRHVRSAIRHLERDRGEEPDACTDVIYRMNQAYEGSLKEAYRVLAERDPSGLSTFEIEQYLETHNVLRPRVLTQLTRYRQDYRNPSTHDYKLDFDEDEALLAIVSVCAFAKLLTNQISSKLAADEAIKNAAAVEVTGKQSLKEAGPAIARACFEYTVSGGEVAWPEFDSGVAEILAKSGATVTRSGSIEDQYVEIVAERDGQFFAIDTRVTSTLDLLLDDPEDETFSYLLDFISQEKCVGGLLILRTMGAAEYRLFKGEWQGKEIYLICPPTEPGLPDMTDEVGGLQEV